MAEHILTRHSEQGPDLGVRGPEGGGEAGEGGGRIGEAARQAGGDRRAGQGLGRAGGFLSIFIVVFLLQRDICVFVYYIHLDTGGGASTARERDPEAADQSSRLNSFAAKHMRLFKHNPMSKLSS